MTTKYVSSPCMCYLWAIVPVFWCRRSHYTVILISIHIYNQFIKHISYHRKIKAFHYHIYLMTVFTYIIHISIIFIKFIPPYKKCQSDIKKNQHFFLSSWFAYWYIYSPTKIFLPNMLLFKFSQRPCILLHAIVQVFHKKTKFPRQIDNDNTL